MPLEEAVLLFASMTEDETRHKTAQNAVIMRVVEARTFRGLLDMVKGPLKSKSEGRRQRAMDLVSIALERCPTVPISVEEILNFLDEFKKDYTLEEQVLHVLSEASKRSPSGDQAV